MMLGQELDRLKELSGRCIDDGCCRPSDREFAEAAGELKEAWHAAAFSEMADHSLTRFFNFQLEGIRQISDALSACADENNENIQQHLFALIEHLQQYFGAYFNREAAAPYYWHQRMMSRLSDGADVLNKCIGEAAWEPGLKILLESYLLAMSDTRSRYSFRCLAYFERLFEELIELQQGRPFSEGSVAELLWRLNFNHLAFFNYQKDSILSVIVDQDTISKLEYLNERTVFFSSFPEENGLAYSRSWPSIKTMLVGWLTEESKMLERTASSRAPFPEPVKLALPLPVSHLALLTRMFYEEGHTGTVNLAGVFRFIARNFSTKRQPAISPGSLSKEFYSADQQTAARVRDLLQRMIQRINKNFFPVLAVANAATLCLANML